MADRTRDTHTVPEGLGLWYQTEDKALIKLDWNGEDWPLGDGDEGSIGFDISERDRRIAVALCQLALERLQAASDRSELEAENDRLRTLLSECGDERSRLRRELARWRTGLQRVPASESTDG